VTSAAPGRVRVVTPGLRLRLLTRLVSAGGRVVSDDDLLLACYGGDEPETAELSVRVTVCHLRRVLPVGTIERVAGYGYRVPSGKVGGIPAGMLLDDRALVPVDELG